MISTASRFEAAVARPPPILDEAQDDIYEAGALPPLHASIIEAWAVPAGGPDVRRRDVRRVGGEPPLRMYDDVPDMLRIIAARGIRIGLISNSHRCLDVVPEPLRARRADQRGRLVV